MEFETALKQELSIIEKDRERLDERYNHLLKTFDVFEIPKNGYATNGNSVHPNASKSDQYKHVIRELIQVPKSYHITDFESEFERKGFEFNKGLIHQVLNSLRESGELIAVRINKSNQKYYYLSPKGKQGDSIKDAYLPMPKKYVESLELM